MSRIVALMLLVFFACTAPARERPVLSCGKAPLLTEFQKQLPGHILSTAAETPPKLVSTMPRFSVPLLKRAGTALVCLVLVLDHTGSVQDVAVSYPAGLALTSKERELLLSLQWSAALVAGQPHASLVNVDIQSR